MSHPLLLTLSVIVDVARKGIVAVSGRVPVAAHSAILWLHNWFNGSVRRLAHILATPYRPRAATRRPRATAGQASAPASNRPTSRPISRPTWRWLQRLTGGAPQVGQLTQFEHFLRDPEVHALVAADPRARRLFRGMCRRLGIRRAPDLPALLFAAASPPAQAPKARPPARPARPPAHRRAHRHLPGHRPTDPRSLDGGAGRIPPRLPPPDRKTRPPGLNTHALIVPL